MPLLENKCKRNSSIEILRIVSMIMIVAHHYIFYGVQQNYNPEIAGKVFSNGSIENKLFSILLLPGGVVGVAVFFMIGGYFGIKNNRINLRRIVASTIVYSVLGVVLNITICLYHGNLVWSSVFIKSVVKCFFPINSSVYWFVTTYVILMVLKPILNKIITSVNCRCHIILTIFFFAEYLIGRTLLTAYFSIFEAIFFYMIGALIQIYKDKFSYKRKLYFLLFVIGWVGYVVFTHIHIPCFDVLGICVSGTLSAIGIFCFFVFMPSRFNELVNIVGNLTFDVYLIHEHPLLREFLWSDLLMVGYQFQSRYYFWFSIASIVGVFIVCSILAFIIQKIIIKRIINKLNTVVIIKKIE